MEELIITSQTTGKKYRAIPNIEQILSGKNSCLGCAFNTDSTRVSTTCLQVTRAMGVPDRHMRDCYGAEMDPSKQIIWVEDE